MRSLLRKIYNSLKCTYVVMLHHVTDKQPIVESCVISESGFCEYIDGKKIVSVYEGMKYLSRKEKTYVMSVDDALEDLYTYIYPKMKEKGLPFVAFISVDLLDKEGYITTEQLLEMSRDSIVTIGSHGCTHVKLNECNDAEAWYEIFVSKSKLESLLNEEIKLYAYSNGIASKRDIKMVKKAGYLYAFGVRPRRLNVLTKMTSRYMLPRYNLLNENTNPI